MIDELDNVAKYVYNVIHRGQHKGVIYMGRRVNKQAISIGIANQILDRVDAESKKLGMNRSAFITMCISQYFKNEEALSLLAQAQDLYEKARVMQDNMQVNFYEVKDAT